MKNNIINMKSVAYYSGLGGLEIKGIQYDIDDHVLCVSNAWAGKKQAHRVKINYTRSGSPFIRVRGYRVPLNECIRM